MSKIDDLIKQYCPNGVKYKELGNIGIFYGGLSGKSKEDFKDGNCKYITYTNIYSNPALKIDIEDKVNIQNGEKQNIIQYGDVLFTGSSETPDECGFSSVVTQKIKENIYLNSFCFGFRLNDLTQFNLHFLKHLFRSYEIRKQIVGTASGVTRFNVSKKRFAKIKIPVPPLPVQEEIVKVLDAFTALEAELEAELEARRKQYAYYRNELLTFERVVTVCIQDICIRICSGGTPSSKRHDYYDGNVPWLRTQDIDFNVINQTSATISDEGLRNSAAQWIPANCVIVAMYGATAAKVAVNSIPLTTNQACCNLQIDETKADVRYVFHWLSNEYEHLKALGEGSQSNINAKKVKSYPISLPPLEEQRRIVSILDRFDKLTNDLSSGLPAEIEARRKQYEYYRDRLLSFDELAV